ncbi:DUF4386 domain-containing protein [Micromonospora sp. WMMD1128]|uniref:DUF4386 domain-containing protein n=1 Tax=Micromonospora sp. WMMD1128 TaxID=3015150 RepID=UPI00248CC8A3|nr:DUF4386 domain-containing protein [Micromonospora sp. WMMD1128]WBB74155.1 DUF4386 domain-containing protein [Micromonospora sp. WMMD1128]
MDSLRKTSLVAGGSYVLTFVSIPTLTLYAPVREADYLLGSGSETPVALGGLLETIVALACIGTAVALFPVLKRYGEARALGFVAARVLEAAGIFVGVASLLTVVALRRAGAGADALVTGQALVALYDSMFLLSQSLIPAVNALLLGSLLYKSRLVPRILPLLGLAGAPLLVAADLGVLFDLWDRLSPVTAVAALPIAVWEFSLGVYLLVKGLRPAPVTAGVAADDRAAQDTAV